MQNAKARLKYLVPIVLAIFLASSLLVSKVNAEEKSIAEELASLNEVLQSDQPSSLAQPTIVDIKITGNRLVPDEEILQNIKSLQGASLNKDQVLQDLQGIYEMGYFDRSGLEAKPYIGDAGAVVEYIVKEYRPITSVEVYGNKSIEEIDLYAIFSDLVGRPENIGLIADKIKELETKYSAEGYILARVTDIDIESDGTLKIFVDEGYISQIRYSGNEKTKESYLNHLLSRTELGEAYNEQKFAKDLRQINSTGYFSSVTRTVKPSAEDSGYTLDINLKEKRSVTLGVGGGINTRTGLFGNASVGAANLRGTGQKLDSSLIIGSGFGSNNTFGSNTQLFQRRNITQGNVNYSIPYFRDTENTLNAYARYYDGPSFILDLMDQKKYNLGAGLSRKLSDRESLNGGLSLNRVSLDDADSSKYIRILAGGFLENDGFNISDKFNDGRGDYICDIAGGRRKKNGECTASDEDVKKARKKVNRAFRKAKRDRKEQLEDGSYVSLYSNYSYNSLDDFFRPRRGWKSQIGLEPSASLGKFDSFVKLDGSTAKYFPLPKQSTFVIFGRTGYDVFDTMPDFDLYRLGGLQGVRGYRPFTELGIGNRVLISSAEIRTPIYNFIPQFKKYKYLRSVDLALFADAGFIGGKSKLNRATDKLNRALSVGAGVRVNLPLVGAIRVDFGIPLVQALVQDKRFFRVNFGLADNY